MFMTYYNLVWKTKEGEEADQNMELIIFALLGEIKII